MFRSAIAAAFATIALAVSAALAVEPVELVEPVEPVDQVASPAPSAFRPFVSVRGTSEFANSVSAEPYLGHAAAILPQAYDVGPTAITNFGYLHTFNVFFDSILIDETFAISGGELMKQQVLFVEDGTNTPLTGWRGEGMLEGLVVAGGDEVVGIAKTSAETSSAGLRKALTNTKFAAYTTYGLRYAKLESDFTFLGSGSILGKTSVLTEVDHDLIGPQLGIGAVAENDMWRLESALLTTLGYQRIEYHQPGMFGEEAIPGALNRPANSRTTTSINEYGEEHVAWLSEIRLTASCRLTPHLRIDGGWRGSLATQFHNATEATRWSAPDFGIRPLDGETVLFDYWTLGVTYEF